MQALIRWALRRSQAQIRHVAPVRWRGAGGLVGQVYRQVERDFGMLAPPVVLHAPAPEVLAAAWSMLRETLVVPGAAGRVSKEVVAASVSLGNTCPYCVDVHGASLHGLAGIDADAITEDRIADPAVRDLARWAHTVGRREVAAGDDTPFPAAQRPELLGVAVTFHYLNRMVNAHLADSPLPAEMSSGARRRALRFLGRFMGSAARRPRAPGLAPALLPAAELPADLAFAGGSPNVAEAFARAAAAIDAAGNRSVPPRVRELVRAELACWDGEPRGPSRAWVEDSIAPLPRQERSAGRLALLTAMASYQIDDGAIARFRADQPDERTLVELTSWASMAAARRAANRS